MHFVKIETLHLYCRLTEIAALVQDLMERGEGSSVTLPLGEYIVTFSYPATTPKHYPPFAEKDGDTIAINFTTDELDTLATTLCNTSAPRKSVPLRQFALDTHTILKVIVTDD